MRSAVFSLLLLALPFTNAVAQPWPLAIKRLAGRILSPIADGTPAGEALFTQPVGVTVDAQQQIFVADAGQGRVYRIDASGKVYTLAAVAAPSRMAVDRAGAVYVIDGLVTVLKITADGRSTRYAGNGVRGAPAEGKPAVESPFLNLADLAFDAQGRLCLADQYAYKILRVEADGTVVTIAGNGNRGLSGNGGPATKAQINEPRGLAFLSTGEMLIADYINNSIRKVANDGIISTYAGATASDPRLKLDLYYPTAISVSPAGDIFFLELDIRVRVISGDVLRATLVTTTGVTAAASHPGGGIVVANSEYRNLVRFPTGSANNSSTLGAPHFAGDNGVATAAVFHHPRHLTANAAGDLYVSDTGNQRIRRILGSGRIETYAGSGKVGYNGDVARARDANFSSPLGLVIDPQNVLYVADYGANRIRTVAPGGGAVTTVAGTGEGGFLEAFDSGPALKTHIADPMSLTRGRDGNIYIGTSHIIKRLTPAGLLEAQGKTGFGVPGGTVGFPNIECIAVDSQATVYFVATGFLNSTTSTGQLKHFDTARSIAIDSKDNIYLGFSDKRYIGLQDSKGVVTVFAGGGSGKPGDLTVAAETDLTGVQSMTFLPDGHLAFILGDSVYRTLTLSPTTLRTFSGDRQKGWIGTDLLQPLRVKVTGMSDLPVGGVKVTFTIVQGSATLLVTSATTDVQGIAGTSLHFANTPGTVSVRASAEGLAPVTFQVTSESLLYQPPTSATTPTADSYLISTVAGVTPGGDRVNATTVWLDSPESLAVDTNGNVVVVDRTARTIRWISTGGVIFTVAERTTWRSFGPVAMDRANTIYLLDTDEIRALGATGITRTLSGKYPGATSIAADGLNRVYVAEPDEKRVRVIFPNNQILIFAGTGAPEPASGLTRPTLVTVANDYTVYIADPGAQTVWRVSPQGVKASFLQADLPFAVSDLTALTVDPAGALYLADASGNIFRASEDTPVAYITSAPGPVSGLVIDAQSNLYATCPVAGQVYKLDSTGAWILTAGISHFSGDGGPALEAALNRPRGVIAAPMGGYYIADTDNGRVRLVDSAGIISTVAGGGSIDPPADGTSVKAREARLTPVSILPSPDGGIFINNGATILNVSPEGDLRMVGPPDAFRATGAMVLDASGRVHFADAQNHRVCRLSPDGTLETIAGDGGSTQGADGTAASRAGAPNPRSVAIDSRGLVYIAFPDRVRRIEADGTWFSLPIAGTNVRALAVDDRGALLVTESNTLRSIAPPAAAAILAGSTDPGFFGDNGPSAQARLNSPYSVTVLPSGEILVADTLNHRIRRLAPTN